MAGARSRSVMTGDWGTGDGDGDGESGGSPAIDNINLDIECTGRSILRGSGRAGATSVSIVEGRLWY